MNTPRDVLFLVDTLKKCADTTNKLFQYYQNKKNMTYKTKTPLPDVPIGTPLVEEKVHGIYYINNYTVHYRWRDEFVESHPELFEKEDDLDGLIKGQIENLMDKLGLTFRLESNNNPLHESMKSIAKKHLDNVLKEKIGMLEKMKRINVDTPHLTESFNEGIDRAISILKQ